MKVLLLVDIQYDFIYGSLPVVGGKEVIPIASKLINSGKFDLIIATQDYHPEDHCSFKTWPVHCVAGLAGSELMFPIDKVGLILRKGMKRDVDSYSAFVDDDEDETGLYGFLSGQDAEVYIAGLVTDYCVKATAMDCMKRFSTYVVSDGCRAVGDGEAALEEMRLEGCKIITSDEV